MLKLTKTGFKCPTCGRRSFPNLVETGYILTHRLNTIEVHGKKVTLLAEGKTDFGECGDGYHIECPNCYETFPLPDEIEIDWQ